MKKSIFRLTCLVLALIAARSTFGAETPAEQKGVTFLSKLKPDQPVSLTEKDGRYEIGIFDNEFFRPQPYTVIEVGNDYVVMRDLAKITDLVVPIYSIKAIRIMKVPGK